MIVVTAAALAPLQDYQQEDEELPTPQDNPIDPLTLLVETGPRICPVCRTRALFDRRRLEWFCALCWATLSGADADYDGRPPR